jgi:hypothetical protein
MNWSDLEYVWKRQAPPAGASADVDVLRRNFEASHRKTAAALAVRDYSEAAAGLLSSAVFAYTWWRLGRDGWPFAITIALILGVSAVFCRERIRSHRRRVGPAVSLLAKLDADIAELRHQRRLIFSITTWYLASLAASWAVAVATLAVHSARHAPPGFFIDLMKNPATASFIIGYFLVCAPLCFWWAWRMNRTAVLERLDPRIEELEKLRRDLSISQ